MMRVLFVLLFACQSAPPAQTLTVSGSALSVQGEDEAVLLKDLADGTIPILGELKGVAASVTTSLELVEASAPGTVLDTASVMGAASFVMHWKVPLGEDKRAHVLEVRGTRSDGEELNRVQVTRRVDTIMPTIVTYTLRPSLTTSGSIDVTLATTGDLASLSLAVMGGITSVLETNATSAKLAGLPVGTKIAATLTATAKNGGVVAQTIEAAAGVVYVDAASTQLQPSGSVQSAYRSIGAAMTAVHDSTLPFIVHAKGGTYSAAGGETFPIVLEHQRTIEGEVGPSGEPTTLISGGGAFEAMYKGSPFSLCLTMHTPITATSQNVRLRDLAFSSTGATCSVSAGFLNFNALATMNRLRFGPYPSAYLSVGNVCVRSSADDIVVTGQTTNSQGVISTQERSHLSLTNSRLEGVYAGVTIGADLEGPTGDCLIDGDSIAGTTITATDFGVCVNEGLQVDFGSSDIGRRNSFTVVGGNSSSSECKHAGIAVRQRGDQIDQAERLSICDTDIVMGAPADNPGPNLWDWPAGIHLQGNEVRFGQAQGGFGGVTCSSAKTSRIQINDPRIHGISLLGRSSLQGSAVVVTQAASDFASFKSGGIFIRDPGQSRHFSISSSTVTGFSRNLIVDGASSGTGPLLLSLNDVCVNAGAPWATAGTGQTPTVDGFVPSGTFTYNDLDPAMSSHAQLNYLVTQPFNMASVSSTHVAGPVCRQ